MGHSKNRRKRRLGRIRKFVENIYPVTKKDYSLRRDNSFGIWCGGWAWLSAVFNGYLDVCISEAREARHEVEMVVTENGFKYPKQERDANDKRFRRFLQFMKEFDESKISHTHTNNYEVVVNGALFYYCPDGTYTTSDDLIVEFGKGKQDLIIKGAYGKYRKSQLTIPESFGNVWVSKISKRSFENQDSLRQVVLSCKIPEIPKKAFENCELLTTVVMPESVTKIGSEALGECPALTSIMYLGTKAQWHEIKKHKSWDRKTGNYRVYCVDGVLPKIHARGQGDLL